MHGFRKYAALKQLIITLLKGLVVTFAGVHRHMCMRLCRCDSSQRVYVSALGVMNFALATQIVQEIKWAARKQGKVVSNVLSI